MSLPSQAMTAQDVHHEIQLIHNEIPHVTLTFADGLNESPEFTFTRIPQKIQLRRASFEFDSVLPASGIAGERCLHEKGFGSWQWTEEGFAFQTAQWFQHRGTLRLFDTYTTCENPSGEVIFDRPNQNFPLVWHEECPPYQSTEIQDPVDREEENSWLSSQEGCFKMGHLRYLVQELM